MLNLYLTFDGTCEEAFDFYQKVFNGKILVQGRFSEMPTKHPIPEEEKNRIMHTRLDLGDGTVIMGSDSSAAFGPLPVVGTHMAISISPQSEAHADEIFNGLAEGGKITMPLAKTFWNAYYGKLTDKFGIQWMVNYEYPADGS